jgi:hypothetical protein
VFRACLTLFSRCFCFCQDILCGRGGLTNHHKGNKRFRDVVTLHRPDYVRAPKIQKPSVARVIVRAIRNGDPPGRFLRKDQKTGLWVDIGDKRAAEKTSQALREKTIEEKGKQSGVPALATAGSPTPVLPNPENGDKEAKGEKSASGDKGGKTDVEKNTSKPQANGEEKIDAGGNAETQEAKVDTIEV